MSERIFEWDDEKASRNIKKHGVHFEDAALVFDDADRIEEYDVEHSVDEDRWITIGMVDAVLYVVYTERGEATRLISARKATPHERRRYYDHQEMY